MKYLLLSLSVVALLVSCQPKEKEQLPENAVNNKSEIVVDNILTRHSIRKYTSQQVSREQLDIIIKCAINAPSAKNNQPWEVRIIQNPDLLAKIKSLNAEFYGSPTLIVIAKDKNNQYGDFDCGLLSQNLMLTAHSLGLGTCALGSVGRILCLPEAKDIVDALDLPEGYEPIICLSIGHPDEEAVAKPREISKVKYVE